MLDTAIIIEGIATPGPCHDILRLALAGEFHLMSTIDIDEEYRSAANRPGVRALLHEAGVDAGGYAARIAAIRSASRALFPTGAPPVEGDSRTRPFLHCAVVANADYLVTRDRDLLDIAVIEQTRIVTLEAFLAANPA